MIRLPRPSTNPLAAFPPKGTGRILPAMLFLLAALFTPASSGAETMAAWGELTATGHDIYFSMQIGNQWSEPIVISATNNPEILPTLAGNGREIWIAWTELAGEASRLRFRHFNGAAWDQPAEVPTLMHTNLAPALQTDNQGVVWLVWAGSGNHDDIYSSRWTGSAWTEPVMVNEGDDWPDILPVLTLNQNNMPQVVWKGYNGEKYVEYISTWDGAKWSKERELPPGAGNLAGAGGLNLQLPPFLTSLDQAALFTRNPGEAGRVYHRQELNPLR